MGFFDKVKKFFGPCGVKMVVQLDSKQLEKDGDSFSGKVTLTADKDQLIDYLVVKLTEDWTTGRGENKQTKTFVLGEISIKENFPIKAGETQAYNFTCEYERLRSENDRLKDGGSVSKTLGKLGSMMDNEKSDFEVYVSMDIKGVFNTPSERIKVQLS
jgi:RecA-family ATPase